MREPHPVTIRRPTEGRTIGIVGDIYRFMATGEETGGRYAMFEAIVLPDGGPPPHIHRREDETFYVLEGEITFQVGDERIVAGPGTFINMPIGNPHAFKNETDKTAKMLISYAPAGLEDYFFEVGQPFDGELPPKPTKEEIDKLLEAGPRYGIEFILPAEDSGRLSLSNSLYECRCLDSHKHAGNPVISHGFFRNRPRYEPSAEFSRFFHSWA